MRELNGMYSLSWAEYHMPYSEEFELWCCLASTASDQPEADMLHRRIDVEKDGLPAHWYL